MKKSHRKDVILARIVFVIFCILAIAAIVAAVLMIKEHMRDSATGNSQTQVQTEESQTNTFPVIDSQDEPSVDVEDTQPTQVEDTVTVPVKTTSGVNLRSEPNTNCSVLTVLTQGTLLEMVGEEDGWAMVAYQGQTDYVKMDYIEEVVEAPES